MMEMLFVSCVCLFSLLLVPVSADVRNGNLTEQRGMCNASWRKRTPRMAGECIPVLRPPPLIILADFLLKSPYLKRPLKTRRNLRRISGCPYRTEPSMLFLNRLTINKVRVSNSTKNVASAKCSSDRHSLDPLIINA